MSRSAEAVELNSRSELKAVEGRQSICILQPPLNQGMHVIGHKAGKEKVATVRPGIIDQNRRKVV